MLFPSGMAIASSPASNRSGTCKNHQWTLVRYKASICGSGWKETRESREDEIAFPRKTSVPWWSYVSRGMKYWASEWRWRCWKERTSSDLIPRCQALCGAHFMYSATVPQLSTFHIHCTCEILGMSDMKFCNAFWKVGYCQNQESNSHPANNQT